MLIPALPDMRICIAQPLRCESDNPVQRPVDLCIETCHGANHAQSRFGWPRSDCPSGSLHP